MPTNTASLATSSEPSIELSEQAIRRVRRRLRSWGRRHYRDYTWRSESDPWLTLVAEFLLQRTRSSQVEPIFRDFRTRYPAAADLVRAGPDAAQAVTAGLGIHWRGPLLYRLAIAVVENGGIPPESLHKLGQITGVGPYTTAAWLSLHRGQRAVIVDSNVFRWLGRMTGRPYQRDPRHIHWVNELADQLTPQRAFREYNYAVLDFTMSICTPREPHCPECPLRRDCEFGRRSRSPR
ncbi:MAG: hypothetical protein ACRDJH_27565 [Thermomicrobiales bacterium]